MTSTVAVLFARRDSIYKTIPGCDVWDEDRDARNWLGGTPVVAHPPCRAWGKLKHLAKPKPGEKELARWAVRMVREHGGVLEHPAASQLWPDQHLPQPGVRDAFGGWTLPIHQFWFGHRAEKETYLYIVGVSPQLVDFPISLYRPTHVIASSSARQHRGPPAFRPEVTKAEREHTPPMLAHWLVDLARRCGGIGAQGRAA